MTENALTLNDSFESIKIDNFNHHLFGDLKIITDNSNQLWFIGKEVADSLSYSNTRDALRKHVKDHQKLTVANRDAQILTNNQMARSAVLISEAGLYSLIFGAKTFLAEKFQDWVTSEVLPSIRKTGQYKMSESDNPLVLMSERDKVLLLAEQAQRMVELIDQTEEQALLIEEQQQTNQRLNHTCNSLASYFSDGVSVRELAMQLNGVRVDKINGKLVDLGYLHKVGKNGQYHYAPTGRFRNNLFTYCARTITIDGKEHTTHTVNLTKKGVKTIIKHYLAGELPMRSDWDGNYSSPSHLNDINF